MISNLIILLIISAIQIAHRLNLTRLHIHQDHAAPIGTSMFQTFTKCCLANIHQVSIEGGINIATIFRLSNRHILPTACNLLPYTHSILATQIRIITQLQSRTSLSTRRINITYCPAAQTVKRLYTQVQILRIKTTLIHPTANQWQLLNLLQLGIGNTFATQADITFFPHFAAIGSHHSRTILLFRLITHNPAQPLCNAIHMRPKQFPIIHMQRLHTSIHVDTILRHTTRQQPTVAIKDIASYCLDSLVIRLTLIHQTLPLVTLSRLNHNDANKHHYKQQCYHHKHNSKTQNRMSQIIAHLIRIAGLLLSVTWLPFSFSIFATDD